jgi:hypothetical protein
VERTSPPGARFYRAALALKPSSAAFKKACAATEPTELEPEPEPEPELKLSDIVEPVRAALGRLSALSVSLC